MACALYFVCITNRRQAKRGAPYQFGILLSDVQSGASLGRKRRSFVRQRLGLPGSGAESACDKPPLMVILWGGSGRRSAPFPTEICMPLPQEHLPFAPGGFSLPLPAGIFLPLRAHHQNRISGCSAVGSAPALGVFKALTIVYNGNAQTP